MDQNLDHLRSQIDLIDEKIQALIQQRAELAIIIGQIKRSLEKTPNYYCPEREKEVIKKIIHRNTGPISDQQLIALFRQIMQACLLLQKANKIAYLGPQGTFSQLAVMQYFGRHVEMVPIATIEKIFEEIALKNVDYGVVPIENSTTGMISQTEALLKNNTSIIADEIILPIKHHLLCAKDSNSKIQRIYGHEQALKQCAKWLQQHMPNIETVTTSSNGESVQLAVTEHEAAAIAGELALDYYPVKIIASHIHDNPDNSTRFLILGPEPQEKL